MSDIKTFVRRKQNRMTPSQKRALESECLKSRIGDIERLIASEQPIILDIGFGMGDSLITLAKKHVEALVVGIDIYQPGIARALKIAETSNLSNLMIIDGDATEILEALPCSRLMGVQLLFPDPWPKKRHFKRRFVQVDRLKLIYEKLQDNGWMRLITDSNCYAEYALNCINNTSFSLQLESSRLEHKTKYWLRALQLKHNIHKIFITK